MPVPRSSAILLLAFPLVLLWAPPITGHRVMKGGCLNYGHSCLGAHGKRASVPVVPRPLLDIIMDALNTPEHTNNQYPFAVVSSISEPRSGVPARRFLTPDEGVDLRMGRVVGVDDLETLRTRVKGDRLGSMSGQDQDAMVYYGSLDDDYSDDRYKRHVVPYKRPPVATSAASRVAQAAGSQTWGSSRLQNELKQAEELQQEEEQKEEQQEEQQEEQHEEQQEEQQQGARDHVHQRSLASQDSWWRR